MNIGNKYENLSEPKTWLGKYENETQTRKEVVGSIIFSIHSFLENGLESLKKNGGKENLSSSLKNYFDDVFNDNDGTTPEAQFILEKVFNVIKEDRIKDIINSNEKTTPPEEISFYESIIFEPVDDIETITVVEYKKRLDTILTKLLPKTEDEL
jgi:hypothetical protein